MATSDRVAAQDPISAVSTAELEELERERPREEVEDSDLFFNRETSWVRFNERVLELAEDTAVPLLERVKFSAIYAKNLDEFFMVRVAGLHDQVDAGITEPLADGRTPAETIDALREKILVQFDRLTRNLSRELLPALAEHGVRIVTCGDLTEAQREELAERFRRQIFPVLTPLAVGLGRPFPYISNLSLSLAVLVRDPLSDHTTFARVKLPKEMLDRFVDVDGGKTFVPLEQVIAANLDALFPGMEIVDHGFFRVTRDADFEVSDEADDLLRAVEAELRRRRFGEVVRVEVNGDMAPALGAELIEALEVEPRQVYDLVGLEGRFDGRSNSGWARALEEAGVHGVYGHPSLKTHAKCILVVRREGDGVRHYLHIGTGNYHPTTARLYNDFGLFTDDQDIGDDVADMFNFLTGYARPRGYRQVLVAPDHMREGIIDEIRTTVEAHERGEPVRIRMKMNSLVDKACIRALYDASRAGVPIDLNVRGICCLKPGREGVSDNIRVVSIVGRFLEHSRIYAFERGDEQAVWIGSADLMPRNLDTRVELMTRVQDPTLRDDLLDTLERCFGDDTNAWELDAHGPWRRRTPQGPEPRSVQRELMLGHAARAAETVSA